jgi:lysophospholipase L1-like esterase
MRQLYNGIMIKFYLLFVLVFVLNTLENACKASDPKTIITIGDSNGALPDGWVKQLRTIRAEDRIINFSISGNTIGFNNSDNEKLNTLSNIDSYLKSALDSVTHIDYVIFLLGTNDCKASFDRQMDQVSKNMEQLILKTKAFPLKKKPEIFIISPPPYGPDSILIAKYAGAPERVKNLVPQLKQIARQQKCRFIDIYTPLVTVFMNYSKDGVHLNSEGQMIIAKEIAKKL